MNLPEKWQGKDVIMKNSKYTFKITTIGILTGLSVVLVFLVRFPIFPAAPFLEYDPADIPILLAAFAFGPIAGITSTIIASIIQGITVSSHSGIYGIIMHILSTGSYVLVAGLIYRAKRDRFGGCFGLLVGVVVSAIVMAIANLIITPLFMGVPVEAVKQMLIPVVIPFNLLKSGINGVIVFAIYKPISNYFIKSIDLRKS